MQFSFAGQVIEWRGPSPFYFLPLSAEISAEIKNEASLHTYGWGVIPVRAMIGKAAFTTALIPREGLYLVPIKDVVRKAEGLEVGSRASIEFSLGRS